MNTISALSPDLVQQRLTQLRKLIPEAFSEGKLDIAALKRVLGETAVIESGERYRLDWAGKTDSYKLLQTPSSATLRPERDKSSIDFDHAAHVFIEGENLEVLKVLQKSYFGKIKLIYIDPPYNTGSDSFIYPDRFQESKEDYLKRINELNDDGRLMREGAFRKNSRENGHYHSNWLSMMLPRLSIARNLLREDGVIFVSIDDNEVHNLRCLMNEIFGEENFRNIFSIRRYDKNLNMQFFEKGLKTFNIGFEYVICYAKSEKFHFCPVNKEAKSFRKDCGYWKGFWNDADRPSMRYEILGFTPDTGQWKWAKEKAIEAIENYNIYQKYFSDISLEDYWIKTGRTKKFIRRNLAGAGKNKGVEHWIEPSDYILRNTNWTDVFASKKSLEVGGHFDFAKNIELLKLIIECADCRDSIILDFFAGSSSTAHAVMQANYEDGGNRQFIMVQLPEKCAEDSLAFKAGYSTIADISRQRIRKVLEQIEKEQSSDLLNINKSKSGFKSFVLSPSNFKQWRGDHIETAEQLAQQIELFTQPEKDGATTENILFELFLKFGQPLTTPIEILDIISQQPTANSQQPTANSQQPTANSQQPKYTL